MIRNRLLLLLFLGFLAIQAKAQEFGQEELSDPKIEQAKGIVNTLAYYFNLLGGNRTSASEKETIINNSYLKLFLNERVQVEDDLQDDRSTVIYKDVQAYLKDIDFFFEEAQFNFEIDTVTKLFKADSTPYYRVDLIRNINAISLTGDSLNTTRQRFVELNLGPKGEELKIASIYTTKISKEKQLREWWGGLTLAWKQVFQNKLGVFYDSLSNDELFDLVTLDSLDISGNDLIIDIEPIYQLTSLKHLKLSNTWVNDLKPLLSINKLQSLDVSNTSVFDLQYLKYHKDIRSLNLSNCHVEDFSALKGFDKLSHLNLNGIAGINLSFVNDLKNLETLKIEDGKGLDWINFEQLSKLKNLFLKNSDVITLSGLNGLQSLQELDVSSSQLASLSGFENLRSLVTLRINNTDISVLEPISKLSNLKRVYANGTSLKDEAIQQFSAQNKALLITNAAQLMAWWEGIPSGLKTRLGEMMETNTPQVEDLSALIRIDSLDASKTGLQNLEALERFQALEYLNLDGNRIGKLSAPQLSSKLITLTFNDTDVNDLESMEVLAQLEYLEANNTALASLSQLQQLPKLRAIYVDGANVGAEQIADLLEAKPQLRIRFMTAELEKWWLDLTPTLKKSFAENASLSDQPDSDELHVLIALRSLSFKNIPITAAFQESLDKFYRLRELKLQQVRVSLIQDLPELKKLESLELLQMPIADLTGLIQKYPELKRLNITNTAVEDLRPLEGLNTLEMLNFSGTNVKRLKGLEGLLNLKEIDCSNTKVFKFDRIGDLKNLKKVTCFNTGLRQNDIDKLLESLPEVEIIYY